MLRLLVSIQTFPARNITSRVLQLREGMLRFLKSDPRSAVGDGTLSGTVWDHYERFVVSIGVASL